MAKLKTRYARRKKDTDRVVILTDALLNERIKGGKFDMIECDEDGNPVAEPETDAQKKLKAEKKAKPEKKAGKGKTT